MTDQVLTFTATCRAGAGFDEATGELVPASVVTERVRWASQLVGSHVQGMLAAGYTPEGLSLLGGGKDQGGVRLPSWGYKAGRRLGWVVTPNEGLYLSDRFRRIIEEAVMRRLRAAVWVDKVVAAVVETWPEKPKKRSSEEWAALWAVLPAGTDKATVRNRTRQIGLFLEVHGRFPAGVTDLEPTVRTGSELILAAADDRLVTIVRTSPTAAVLRVKLPSAESPATRADWSFITLKITVPPHVPINAKLCTPTVRVVDGRVRVDLPWRILAPVLSGSGHTVAVGFDWGVNTFITATIASLDSNGEVFTDGKPFSFRTNGATAKIHRLRKLRETLQKKRVQNEKLLEGLPETDLRRETLEQKTVTHTTESDHISARQRHLNTELGRAGARWLIDIATQNKATVIYAEDLNDLEPSGLGREQNTRCSNAVRTELLNSLRHQGTKQGITIVVVPARGTSKQCPRCLTVLRHVKAPNRPVNGHKWSVCHGCGHSADRDHAAAERITQRGLTTQKKCVRNRKTGKFGVTTIHDQPVRRSLKPKQRNNTKRRDRSTISFPITTNTVRADHRPMGTCRTDQTPTGSGNETGNTVIGTLKLLTWVQVVGRGFHRNVHATPVSRPVWRHQPDHSFT